MANFVDPISADTRFFGHPRGLATLFFTEMWERFSYYGMRAILILFMTDQMAHGGLGFNDAKAGAVYGLYTAMVYLLCLGGGWVADRITGQRRAVLIGGILIAIGEFCLMAPAEALFYLGLVLLMMGTGLLKGNVEHHRRPALPQGRPAPRFGLFHFLHGDQYRRSDLAHHLRLRRGEDQLAVGLRRGRHRHAGRPGSISSGSQASWASAGLRPASTGDPELDRRQKRNACAAVASGWVSSRCWNAGGSGGRDPLQRHR